VNATGPSERLRERSLSSYVHHFQGKHTLVEQQCSQIRRTCLRQINIQGDKRQSVAVCSCLIVGIAGSNPADGTDILLFFGCSADSGFSDWLTTRSEESYRVCVCVCVCV